MAQATCDWRATGLTQQEARQISPERPLPLQREQGYFYLQSSYCAVALMKGAISGPQNVFNPILTVSNIRCVNPVGTANHSARYPATVSGLGIIAIT